MEAEVTINWVRVGQKGPEIQLEPRDIVVFVGPNNVGKSAALRDIEKLLRNMRDDGVVVTAINIRTKGSRSDLRARLVEQAVHAKGVKSNPELAGMGWSLAWENAAHLFEQATKQGLQDLANVFCMTLGTESRLSVARPPLNISAESDAHSHPIHSMQFDEGLEDRLCKAFRKAFNTDLVVNRNAGKTVPLHVGDRPKVSATAGALSMEYARAVMRLPKLHEQGDGMRSFAGVLLHAATTPYSVLFIDEPEAFLHPPQARLLGRMLAGPGQVGRQMFLGTHSGDLVRGLLDTGASRLRVVRLSRENNETRAQELKPSEVAELWKDPLLRYSNALDGLFHDKVIVCEADTDCRFYGATYDAMCDADDVRPRKDVMFVHCGGKDRVHLLVRALRQVGVPTAAVCDFDVLREEQPLRRIAEALGMEWSRIQSDWNALRGAMSGMKPSLSRGEVSREIQDLLAGVPADSSVPTKVGDGIRQILRRSSPWDSAKSVGVEFVPGGDVRNAVNRLLEALASGGLFVVKCGELESFDKTIGGHGPKWVNEVVTKDLANDPNLRAAREMVNEVVG